MSISEYDNIIKVLDNELAHPQVNKERLEELVRKSNCPYLKELISKYKKKIKLIKKLHSS